MAGGYNRGKRQTVKVKSKSHIEPFVKSVAQSRAEITERISGLALSEISYKDVYTEPYILDKGVGYVYDSNNNFMFEFPDFILEDTMKIFVDLFNGTSQLSHEFHGDVMFYTKEDEIFGRYCGDISDFDDEDLEEYLQPDGSYKIERVLIIARGYGNLTGTGGFDLSNQQAIAVQDSMLNGLVGMLNNNAYYVHRDC